MPKSVAPDLAVSLRRRIDAGEWRNSRQLPNERDLAVEYRVARNTMRRAIDSIVADGVLTRHVGRGTFLAETEPGTMNTIIRDISGASPADMMAVRLILEPRAASLAAANGSGRELQEIAEIFRESVAATDMEAFERLDADLHQKIFEASRNELLAHLHSLLRAIRSQEAWRDIKRRSFGLERRATYCAEHGALVEALLRRDGDEASAVMKLHIETVHRNLFGSL